jgi:hypothetical protein
MKTSYQQLSINERINAKANSLIFSPRNGKPILRTYFINSHPALWRPGKLMLEADGIHNNRNYDGPDYSGYYGGDWGAYVDQYRMIEAQKLK